MIIAEYFAQLVLESNSLKHNFVGFSAMNRFTGQQNMLGVACSKLAVVERHLHLCK